MSKMEPEKVEKILKLHLRRNQLFYDEPTLWTVRYSPLGGRGMFATQDIEKGKLIFVDAALLIGPRIYDRYLPMCVNCNKRECPLFPCDRGCGLPICSQQCEDSPRHIKLECEYLQERKPKCTSTWSMDLLRAVVPIRALSLSNEERDVLATLQYHQNECHGHEVKLLQRNVINAPSSEEIQFMEKVCQLLDTNAFETVAFYDRNHSTSLRGLYPIGALQNHGCVPNTRHHFDSQQRLYVSATRFICAGEELTMTYVDLLWDTTLRRQLLNTTKHFSCNCNRCCDPSEFGSLLGALLCATDNCSGILLPCNPVHFDSPWKCNKCTTTINCRQIRSIRSGLAAIMEKSAYKTPRQLLRFIKKELSVLVPATNYIMVDMKFRIISYFGRTQDLSWIDLTDAELAIKSAYCNDLLSLLNCLGCGDCKKRGLILYELYSTDKEQLKRSTKACINKNENAILHESKNEENELLLKEATDIFQNDISAINILEDDSQS